MPEVRTAIHHLRTNGEEQSPFGGQERRSKGSFDRQKVLKGMIRACEKLPVSLEALENAVSSIEEELYSLGVGEVSSASIGEMVAIA